MKKNSKKKGMGFENKVVKTINSGSMWFDKTDLKTSDYCIEVKFTEKKGYRITLQSLEKLWEQSLNANKLPKLIVGIRRNDKEIFILNCNIEVE